MPRLSVCKSICDILTYWTDFHTALTNTRSDSCQKLCIFFQYREQTIYHVRSIYFLFFIRHCISYNMFWNTHHLITRDNIFNGAVEVQDICVVGDIWGVMAVGVAGRRKTCTLFQLLEFPKQQNPIQSWKYIIYIK